MTYYLALHTATPTETQSSNEVAYTGYTRAEVEWNTAQFTVGESMATNKLPIRFSVAPSLTSDIVGVSIGTGATILGYNTITQVRLGRGGQLVFNPGTLTISFIA